MPRTPDIWGVLGGMGPLASAEFIKTIYSVSDTRCEQHAPTVVLVSDPTIPDRTQLLQKHTDEILFQCLTTQLRRLVVLGATRIVLCCVTMHYLLPRLSVELRDRVLSLLDVMFTEMLVRPERHILLCSTGAREARLFESHPLWTQTHDRIILPGAGDQRRIHDLIYRLKAGGRTECEIPFVIKLLKTNRASSFIAGCTELHLLTKHFQSTAASRKWAPVDPLRLVATRIARSG